ncbi:sulfotransferase family protein [Streptomyces sp. NPDC059070]|uniref:sulfotransferase family protein n=1 Tax=unclassified Streptomyces TaxID=2593676 RepID=UPI0034E1CAEF
MRFIFVGGSARSGTSLVQKLLVSHSAIAGGPEFDHTAAIFRMYRDMAQPWRLERQSFYYDAAGLAQSFKQFYEGFFTDVAADKTSARFISEKTPSNLAVAETLLRLWPDAVFVNVVRDGRDVVLSHRDVNRRYRERGERNPERDHLLNVSRYWNASAEQYFALSTRPELRDRVHLVEFEKLVSDPEPELAKLFGFLDLPIEDLQRSPEAITEQQTGVVLEGAYFTKELYRQPYNPGKTLRWRKEMKPVERTLSTVLMRNNLQRFGYPV